MRCHNARQCPHADLDMMSYILYMADTIVLTVGMYGEI